MSAESDEEFYRSAQFLTGLVLFPVVVVYGLVGNAFILAVLRRRPMRNSTNVYLKALAVADTIKLLNDMLYSLTALLLQLDEKVGQAAYAYLYPYAHFVFNVSVSVQAWLTVSVSFERYLMVCAPAAATGWTNIPRATVICTLCFVVMTTLSLPSVFRYRTVFGGTNDTVPNVNLTIVWTKHPKITRLYTWIQFSLRSILPFLILVVLNWMIIAALRRTRANRRQRARHRITGMLLIVTGCFMLCILPDAIMSAFFNYGYHEGSFLIKGVREITDWLLCVNAAINFTLYIVFNTSFRTQFVEMCACRCLPPSSAATSADYQQVLGATTAPATEKTTSHPQSDPKVRAQDVGDEDNRAEGHTPRSAPRERHELTNGGSWSRGASGRTEELELSRMGAATTA